MQMQGFEAFQDPMRWLADQDARIEAIKERAERAKGELASSQVSVTSPDRIVTVTVNAGGVVLNVAFGPQARGRSEVALTSAFMTAYRKACAQAAARTLEILRPVTGEDSPTLEFLKQSMPAPVEDDRR